LRQAIRRIALEFEVVRHCACLVFSCGLLSPLSHAGTPVTVHIAMSEAAPAASYVEEGQTTGVSKELLKALFDSMTEYKPAFHLYPWTRAQSMVENGKMDLFVTFPSTSRRRYANFSVQQLYHFDYGNLVYDRTSSKAAQIASAKSFADLRKLVFVSQETVAWETENVPKYIRRYTVNVPAALLHMTFQRKMGDFFIMPAEQAVYYAKQLGYQRQLGMKKVSFIPNSEVGFHIGIRNSHPDGKRLMAAVEAALKHPDFVMKKRAIELKYHAHVHAPGP
jgi:hypothetical protein